jgi:hypothetical protein
MKAKTKILTLIAFILLICVLILVKKAYPFMDILPITNSTIYYRQDLIDKICPKHIKRITICISQDYLNNFDINGLFKHCLGIGNFTIGYSLLKIDRLRGENHFFYIENKYLDCTVFVPKRRGK